MESPIEVKTNKGWFPSDEAGLGNYVPRGPVSTSLLLHDAHYGSKVVAMHARVSWVLGRLLGCTVEWGR